MIRHLPDCAYEAHIGLTVVLTVVLAPTAVHQGGKPDHIKS